MVGTKNNSHQQKKSVCCQWQRKQLPIERRASKWRSAVLPRFVRIHQPVLSRWESRKHHTECKVTKSTPIKFNLLKSINHVIGLPQLPHQMQSKQPMKMESQRHRLSDQKLPERYPTSAKCIKNYLQTWNRWIRLLFVSTRELKSSCLAKSCQLSVSIRRLCWSHPDMTINVPLLIADKSRNIYSMFTAKIVKSIVSGSAGARRALHPQQNTNRTGFGSSVAPVIESKLHKVTKTINREDRRKQMFKTATKTSDSAKGRVARTGMLKGVRTNRRFELMMQSRELANNHWDCQSIYMTWHVACFFF